MSRAALRRLYAGLVAALFVCVALWRRDLVEQAWLCTAAVWSSGGRARGKLLGEIALFGGVLWGTWRTIPAEARPARDAATLLLAGAAGWCAEAWGTRLGIWIYYTGERPPAWIVPAWPLGALLIDRLAERVGASRRVPTGAYPALALAMLCVCAGLQTPWRQGAAAWLGLAAAAAALLAGARPREDFWVLACGLPCVFFADLWGTTNHCWSYPLIASAGAWRGILFGMVFDTAVVAGCLRLARGAGTQRSPAS